MNSTEERPVKEVLEEAKRARREKIVVDLRRRAPVGDGPGCFLCSLILQDIEKNGKLTGYPLDSNGGATFPREGKIEHLRLEGFLASDLDTRKP